MIGNKLSHFRIEAKLGRGRDGRGPDTGLSVRGE